MNNTMKMLTAVFMAILMVSSATIPLAYADTGTKENAPTSGTSGGIDWNYDADKSELTISVSATPETGFEAGKMRNYSSPWKDCVDKDVTLVIKDGVKNVGSGAFRDMQHLTAVSDLPDSIETIGTYAFMDSGKFTGEFKIPKNVSSIGDRAFGACTGITAFKVDESNTTFKTIDNYPMIFQKNTDADEYTIIAYPAGYDAQINLPTETNVVGIGPYAFAGCYKAKGILNIPVNIKTIGKGAFENCRYITSVSIGSGVTTLPTYAFSQCFGLETVNIGEKVATIEPEAFYECTGLKKFTVDAKNEEFKANDDGILLQKAEDGFIICKYPAGKTGTVAIPTSDDIVGIGESAFEGCDNVKGSLLIPDNIKTVGDYAFCYCENLTSISIGGGITELSEGMFYGCTGLVGVNFGINVTKIGDSAFEGCKGIKELMIGGKVEIIGDSAFECCSGLQTVVMGPSVRVVDDFAFNECGALSTVILGPNVETIGDFAFEECASLKNIVLDDNLKTIGMYAFDGTGLSGTVVLPDSLQSIGRGAYGCTGVNAFGIGAGNSVFKSVDGMILSKDGKTLVMCPPQRDTAPTIPESVTAIGDYAFIECEFAWGGLVIPETVKTIGKYAFYWNDIGGTLVISENVESIGKSAFNGSTVEKVVICPDKVTIGPTAFCNCESLKEIDVLSSELVLGGGTSDAVMIFDTLYDENGNVMEQTSENLCKKRFVLGEDSKMVREEGNIATVSSASGGHGTVDGEAFIAKVGSKITVDGDKVIIDGHVITAKADDGYELSGWNVKDGDTVTGNMTITAEFREKPASSNGDNTVLYVVIGVIAALVIIGGGYYFLYYRKQ